MLTPRFSWLLTRPFARLVAALVVAWVVALLPLAAYAAQITVDGTTCTLPDAIAAANTNTAAGGCTAGSGADTLLLAAGAHNLNGIPLFADDSSGFSHGDDATPPIISDITVIGQGNGSTVASTGTGSYRLFDISTAGRLTIENVTITNFNILGSSGGAIYNNGTLTLRNSSLVFNTASFGGGLYNSGSGTATITNSHIDSNTALESGGGIHNAGGTINLTNSQVGSKIVTDSEYYGGGGLFNSGNGTVNITNSHIVSNTATSLEHFRGYGGGLLNSGNGTVNLTDSHVRSNTANSVGGGVYNQNGTANISGTHIVSNTAYNYDGGGIANGGAANITNSHILSNTAASGGGIDNSGILTISNSRLIANQASQYGGALYQTGSDGSSQLTQNCIVNNSDVAVFTEGSDPITANSNWWGAPDGPSAASTGAGESVGANVDFSDFLTSAILDCPTRSPDLSFSKSIEPLGSLVPGQPITYTIHITNNTDHEINNLFVRDSLPITAFLFTGVISTGATIAEQGGSHSVDNLSASGVATLHFVGQVDPALSNDFVLNNSATLLKHETALITDTVSATVTLPVVQFTAVPILVAEKSGNFEITLSTNRANPFVAGYVELLISDTGTSTKANGTNSVQNITAVRPITFTAGATTQQVTISVADDGVVGGNRTIELTLQNPVRLGLGESNSASVYVNVEIYLPKIDQ